MPIYEFYCSHCHTQYSFFSAGVDAKRRPLCPLDHETRLERRPSTFSLRVTGRDAAVADDEYSILDGLDESRVSGALEMLAREMDTSEQGEDPRSIGAALRRFGEVTGMQLGDRMQEALSRLESGEDLEAIEADLDQGVLEDSDLADFFKLGRAGRARPRVDPELYFFDD